jgi:hypothetical protein
MRERIARTIPVALAVVVVLGTYFTVGRVRSHNERGYRVEWPTSDRGVAGTGLRTPRLSRAASDAGIVPEDRGISFVASDTSPKVSREQAIETATQAVGHRAVVEIPPVAAYGVSTETRFQGDPRIKNAMRDRPVWLVKFTRLTIDTELVAEHIPGAARTAPGVADVFIDAETGRMLLMSRHTLGPVVPLSP